MQRAKAGRRKVQKIVRYDDSHERDIPLQLQPGAQAYIGPEHMLKVPVRQMNERLVEISHCLSNHLRGVQEQRRKPTSAFNDDGSKDWDSLIRHLKDEVANLQEFEVLLCIRNNDDRRFKLRVCLPGGVEGATWKGMRWQPTAVKAVQGHKDWVLERIGNRAICQEIYSLDDDLMSTSWTGGTIPASTLSEDCVQFTCLHTYTRTHAQTDS